LNASGSRPDYVEEFERKLAAAQPCETREWRGPSRKVATASALNGGAPIAVGAATASVARGSGEVGESQPAGALSHSTPLELTLNPSNMAKPHTVPVAAPADPTDGSPRDHASQPARSTTELIGVPAEVETPASEVSQAIADAFPQGGANGREKWIAAAESVVSEAAQVIEVVNIRAHETEETENAKRGSQGWKLKALVLAVSVAMVCAVLTGVEGMLAPLGGPPPATGSNLRETMIPNQGAGEQAQSAEALAPSEASNAGSDLPKDRAEVPSAAVGATATAPRAADTAAVDSIQPPDGLSSEAPTASIVSTPDAAAPATPPLAQSSDITPVPTVSPQQEPTTSPISSAPSETLSEGHAPQPTATPTGNLHDPGSPKPPAPRRDVPAKVVGKPSRRPEVTKTDATSPSVTVGTPAKHDKTAKEPKAAQAAPRSAAATRAAANQLDGLY